MPALGQVLSRGPLGPTRGFDRVWVSRLNLPPFHLTWNQGSKHSIMEEFGMSLNPTVHKSITDT